LAQKSTWAAGFDDFRDNRGNAGKHRCCEPPPTRIEANRCAGPSAVALYRKTALPLRGKLDQHEANRIPRPSASMAANSICMVRADGTPSRWLKSCVPAHSSRIRAYSAASRASRARASSTRRESRALNVPVACQGNSISISSGSCRRRLLLVAIIGSLVLSRLPSAARPVSCLRRIFTIFASRPIPPIVPKCLGAETPIDRCASPGCVHAPTQHSTCMASRSAWAFERWVSGPDRHTAPNGRLAGLVEPGWRPVRFETQDFSESPAIPVGSCVSIYGNMVGKGHRSGKRLVPEEPSNRQGCRRPPPDFTQANRPSGPRDGRAPPLPPARRNSGSLTTTRADADPQHSTAKDTKTKGFFP
jgi:hypothetical protein